MRDYLSSPRSAFLVGLFLLLQTAVTATCSLYGFNPGGGLLYQTNDLVSAPIILAQPQSKVVQPGATTSFSVVPADVRGINYQWQFNNTNLPGSDADTLLVTNASILNQGNYLVILSNGSGSVTSAPAALLLDGDRDGLPDAWEQTYFGGLSQQPGGDYDNDGNSNEEEYANGTNPTNSASALFHLTVLSDGGSVTVNPPKFNYTNGELVTLTATAFAPNSFHGWTGDIITYSNPLTLNITTNLTVIANLATYELNWNAASSGDWFTASNWLPRLVPRSNDTVIINKLSSVTLNTDTECARVILGSSGISPVLGGTGTLTLHKDSMWVAGTLNNGRMHLVPNASLLVSNPATLSLNSYTIENHGAVLWTGANLNMSGGLLTNCPGATFETRGDGTLNGVAATPGFQNSGTFLKTTHTGTTLIAGLAFNNDGVVEVQSGMLALHGGGTQTGSFLMASNTTLSFAATHTSSPTLSITGEGALVVSGGNVTLDGLVKLTDTNSFSGGVVNLTGNYFCNDNVMNVAGGTVNLNGAYECKNTVLNLPGGTANFNGTSLASLSEVNLSGGTLGGNNTVAVDSELNWSSGTMNGSGRTVIASNATLNFFNSGTVILSERTLENRGTVTRTGTGNFAVGSGSVFTNAPGATFEVSNDAAFAYQGGGAGRFDNAGLVRKTSSPGTTTFASGINFNNYGAIEFETGTLQCAGAFLNNGTVTLSTGTTHRMQNGGSGDGTFSAATGALVEWTAGVFTLSSGGQLNGDGLYRISNATLTCNASVAPENLDLVGNATLSGTGTVTVANVLNWFGGSMISSGRTVIASNAALNLLNSGTVFLNSARTLENRGTAMRTGLGNFNAGNGSVLTNAPGAIFAIPNDVSFNYQGGTPARFDNAGLLIKTNSAGTANFVSGFNLNNFGAVEIHSGTLQCSGTFLNAGTVTLQPATTNRLGNGGTISGQFLAPPTSLVEMTSGTFTFTSGALLQGDGLYRSTGAPLTFNTALAVDNLELTGAGSVFGGSGVVTVNDSLNITAGSMSGTGRTVIGPGATCNFANAVTYNINTRNFENQGTVLWTGANIGLGGTVITNCPGALFHIMSGADFNFSSGANRFDNAGIFRKSIDTGDTTLPGGVAFNNYGIVDLQSGILAPNGGFTSTAEAVVNCALGGTTPGTEHGQLLKTGTITLDGTLSVELLPGYIPATNDTFTVVSAGTRSGMFSSFSYPANRVAMTLSNAPSSVILAVTNVFPVPQPVLLPPQLVGSNVLLTWTATSNVAYRLQHKADTGVSNWIEVLGDVMTTSNTASKLDLLTASNRLYRVRALP